MVGMMTTEEYVSALAQLEIVTDGAVYRDRRTGWVGRAVKVSQPSPANLPRGVDGRPKINLLGSSPKEDRTMEYRRAFLDDLQGPLDSDPVGFGA